MSDNTKPQSSNAKAYEGFVKNVLSAPGVNGFPLPGKIPGSHTIYTSGTGPTLPKDGAKEATGLAAKFLEESARAKALDKEYAQLEKAGNLDPSILDKALPTETQAVEFDKFDSASYEEMRKRAMELAKSIADGAKLHEPFNELGQDIFSALYKIDTTLADQNAIKRTHQLNYELIQRAMGTEQYQKLREHTKMDKLNSALASVAISEELKKVLKEEFKDELEQAKKVQDLQSRLDAAIKAGRDAQSVIESIEDFGHQAPADLQQKLQQARKDASIYQDLLSQYAQQFDQSAAGKMNLVRQALRNGMEAAEKEVSAMSGFGWGSGSGELQRMNIEDRLEIARKMRTQAKLRKIAELLGRMKRVAFHAQKNKVHTAKDEIHDVELGGEIARLVPSEVMKLMDPITETAVIRSIIEKEALQYKLEGKEKQAKGSIVCCLDISGSIRSEQDIWQKAIALSLLDIAHSQKRDFACILYDGMVQRVVTIPHNDPQVIKKVVEIGETFTGGGTDFEAPLTVAMGLILNTGKEDTLPGLVDVKGNFTKADIVFITDGEAGLDDGWIEQFNGLRKKGNIKVHSILISAIAHTVSKFSDEVVYVGDLIAGNGFEEAGQVFAEI